MTAITLDKISVVFLSFQDEEGKYSKITGKFSRPSGKDFAY